MAFDQKRDNPWCCLFGELVTERRQTNGKFPPVAGLRSGTNAGWFTTHVRLLAFALAPIGEIVDNRPMRTAAKMPARL